MMKNKKIEAESGQTYKEREARIKIKISLPYKCTRVVLLELLIINFIVSIIYSVSMFTLYHALTT